jgi:hypothetical protein
LLRLCSGMFTLSTGMLSSGMLSTGMLSSGMLTPAQVKAAIAHVQKLKRNQRQGKLALSLGVLMLINLRVAYKEL